jgi:hypothetical protein
MKLVKISLIWILFIFIFVVYKSRASFISTWAVYTDFIFAITPTVYKFLLKKDDEYKKNLIINYFTDFALYYFIIISIIAIIRIFGVPMNIENYIVVPIVVIFFCLMGIKLINLMKARKP